MANEQRVGLYDLGWAVARLDTGTEQGEPVVIFFTPGDSDQQATSITISGPEAVAGLIRLVQAVRNWEMPGQFGAEGVALTDGL